VARVLVVDDSRIMLRTFVRVLTRFGLDVAGTSSPLAALEMARAEPPDVLPADYGCPR
jgi:CheY-like chemotaxis protein